MGRVNRKATGDEMAHATQAIQEAFPEYDVVWGSHGDYGGGRVPPRPHAVARPPRRVCTFQHPRTVRRRLVPLDAARRVVPRRIIRNFPRR